MPALPCDAGTGRWLTPRKAFAEALGIVDRIKAEAADAPIAMPRVRGNVAVLEGSGGNVPVVAGRNGKMTIDAGIAVSRPQMAAALPRQGGHEIGPARHLLFSRPNPMAQLLAADPDALLERIVAPGLADPAKTRSRAIHASGGRHERR